MATLPDEQELAEGLKANFATVGRPETQPITELPLSEGLQQPDGVETDLGTTIGALRISQE